MAEEKKYSESSIQVLDGTEGVRKRPSMYIGDTGNRGLHHLVYEVVDNSIDEAMAGRCSKVDIIIHKDDSISIRDDGAGIPAGPHPKYKVSTLEVILTKLHSGGKFEKKAYQVSGGLHGVGLAAVCALSSDFTVKSYRDGLIYTQRYAEGRKVTDVTTEPKPEEVPNGTLIHFKPDAKIFTVTEFDKDILAGRFRELAYLTTKFRINFTDRRAMVEDKPYFHSFYAEGGIKQFVEDSLGERKALLSDAPVFYAFGEIENVIAEIAFTYSDSYQESLRGFVNNINTQEGGTHISGFKTVLTRTINEFARDFKVLKEKESNLSGNDVREGIIAIISVKVPEPMFEGQTKTKLGNSEIDGYVQSAISQPIKNFLVDNQNMGKAIVNKSIMARRAREAAKKAKDLIRKSSTRVSLPGKLVSSRERDPMKRELFLVEGQSAGGTAVKGRDNAFQEILFLRGKVLNVEKSRLNRALENAEIRNIISAVGTGIQDDFDITKCRYGKVILLTDADVDGAHIATLLFTFFFRYMRGLIEDGRLYIARPPLFKVTLRAKAAKLQGSKQLYLHKEQDLNMLLSALDDMEISRKQVEISRFKGLGEMNANQLEETCMSLETRKIERVSIASLTDAEDWLIRLMGDEVEFRKNYIRNDVFEEIGIDKRGDFYELGFKEEEEEIDPEMDALISQEEAESIEKQIEKDFDEYSPESLLEALEYF